MKNREIIYRCLWGCTNRDGQIIVSQQDLSKVLNISYQKLSQLFTEFTDLGMFRKDGWTFTVLYHPDKIPWERYEDLRAAYSQHRRDNERFARE